MTVRSYAKCSICNFNMMLKIGEGSEPYQPHIFDCMSCYTPITIALRKVENKGYDFELVSNCIPPSKKEVEALDSLPNNQPNDSIICLHSNFAFDLDSFHDPMGAMNVKIKGILKLRNLVKQRWSLFNNLEKKPAKSGPLFIDIANFFDVPDCEHIWTSMIKPYFIASNKKNTQAIEKIKIRYIDERKKYVPKVNVKSHKDLYFDFFSSMFYPRFNEIYQIINKAIVEAKQTNPEEFNKFINYYKLERWQGSQEQQIQLFSEYYSYTTEFAQMRYYARANESNVEKLLVGSKNFDKTKLFYGNAYEVITNEYIFLAGIFNILNGRNFDQFRTMTLHKYIQDCSKESRKTPLETYEPFNNFLQEIESTLRNGSHHASIQRIDEILYYRSGGTGAQREIEYSKYLYLCNRLMILCAAIFCLENKWLNNKL